MCYCNMARKIKYIYYLKWNNEILSTKKYETLNNWTTYFTIVSNRKFVFMNCNLREVFIILFWKVSCEVTRIQTGQMRAAGCHFDMPRLRFPGPACDTCTYSQNAPVITKNEGSYYTCSKLLTRTNRSALELMYNYYQSRVADAINRTHLHSAPRYGTQYNANKMPWFICVLSAQKYTMATSVGVANNTMPPLGTTSKRP